MTQEEIKEVLEKHKHWLLQDCNGWALMRADLRGADLHGVDLREANLCGADLYEADLRRADLSGANLSGARLCGADLYRANLYEAILYGADLRGANLYEATLSKTKIDDEADIKVPMSCPTHGAFIGWKKVQDKIIKLEIPEDARRCSATRHKCRCDKAMVVAIQNADGTDSGLVEILNKNYYKTKYRVGEMVYPDSFDDNRWNECSHGIHFFIDRDEAVNY